MRDLPIIMTGHSPVATREGRKTQTRRVVVPQPPATHTRAAWFSAPVMGWTSEPVPARNWHKVRCPYGVVGDRLWVREAFWQMHDSDSDGYRSIDCGPNLGVDTLSIGYVATPESGEPPVDGREVVPHTGDAGPGDWWVCPPDNWDGTDDDRDKRGRWEFLPWSKNYTKFSPLFMPRWASRLLLEVTDVRVERIQEISYEDILAEGIEWPTDTGGKTNRKVALATFEALWNKINAKRGYGWNENPWVFAISYKVIEGLAPGASHSV
jgi:hypothetical protein